MKKILLITMLLTLALTVFAQETFEKMGNKAANEGDVLFKEGNFGEAAEKYEVALDNYKNAKEKDGLPVDDKIEQMVNNLVAAYYKGKDYSNLVQAFREKLKLEPNDIKTTKNLAIIYKKVLKDIDSAIDVLEDFDSRNPDFSIRKLCASYYLDKNEIENALVWYKKAFELKQDPSVLKNIATSYVKLDRKQEGVETYENFIQTNPSESVLEKVYVNLGGLYEDLKQIPNAKKYYKKALDLEFDDNISLKVITLEYDDKRYNEANAQIKSHLANDPGNDTAIYYRALIKYDTGDKEAALADFQKILNSRTYGSDAEQWIESIESEI